MGGGFRIRALTNQPHVTLSRGRLILVWQCAAYGRCCYARAAQLLSSALQLLLSCGSYGTAAAALQVPPLVTRHGRSFYCIRMRVCDVSFDVKFKSFIVLRDNIISSCCFVWSRLCSPWPLVPPPPLSYAINTDQNLHH